MAINSYLEHKKKKKLISLLEEFKDCFTKKYEDMPDLDNSLVEHILRSKEGFKQYQQLPKRIKSKTQILVKEKMHKYEIIRVAKYN